MANFMPDAWLNGILGAHATQVILSSNTIKLFLYDVGAGGAVNQSTDDFYNDRSAGLVGTAYTLANKTVGSVAAGVFDNTVDPAPAFTGVSGASVEGLWLFKDTGTPADSDLIAYWDTATGLPFTPNGGDVNVTFNASGIIKV